MPLLPLIPWDESWQMPYIWRSSNETNQLILVTHITKSVMLFLLCSLRFRSRQITLHWRKIDNYYDHDIYHNSVAASLKVYRCISASSGPWTSVITSAVQEKKAWLAFAHLGAVDAVSNNLLFISNIITCKFCETKAWRRIIYGTKK